MKHLLNPPQNNPPMRYQLLLVLFLLYAARATYAQCDTKQYTRIFSEAQTLQEQGQFIEAKNKYEAAKIYACGSKDLDKADKAVDALFEQINRLREQADSTALTAYANDLAYKSKIALRDGDRNTAFRLAEFAHRFVDSKNIEIEQALVDALYYNEKPDHETLPRVTNLEGHTGEVYCMAFSPDGKRLASGSEDNTAKVWDFESGKTLLKLGGHEDPVFCLSFSPDGKTLATGAGNKVRIWELEHGEILRVLEGHTENFDHLIFSSDGKKLAAVNEGNMLTIWDIETGKSKLMLEGPTEDVSSMAFSPDNKMLAAGVGNVTKIWDLESAKTVMTLEGHTNNICSVAFSLDCKRLATGDEGKKIIIWDLNNQKKLLNLKGHPFWINSIFLPEVGNDKITSVGLRNMAKNFDLDSGTALIALKVPSELFNRVAFSHDGKRVAATADLMDDEWDISNVYDYSIKVWDLERGNGNTKFYGVVSSVDCAAISPNGKRIAITSSDTRVNILDLESGKFIMTLEGHSHRVNCVSYSLDGQRLATGSFDNSVKIWDMVTGKLLMTLPGHSNYLESVTFSPDGKMLATGSSDETVKIWDLGKGLALSTLKGHSSGISSVAFSPDGERLATGSWDFTAKIWDLGSEQALFTLNGHTSVIFSVAFSPDGKRLATGAADATVKLWDVGSGQTIMTIGGLTRFVKSVAFSTDGKRFAIAAGNLVKIYDSESGEALVTLEGDSSNVQGVSFSQDGQKLITIAGDNTAKIWEINSDNLIKEWQKGGVQSTVSLAQLQQYNLYTLLSLHLDNEDKLINSGEVWQIKAFADLSASQAAGSNILSRVEPHYARADRLYAAALALQDEELIRMDYAKMLRRWAEVCKSDGLESRAADLINKADGLWMDVKN
jgi:WD40 repeat protein